MLFMGFIVGDDWLLDDLKQEDDDYWLVILTMTSDLFWSHQKHVFFFDGGFLYSQEKKWWLFKGKAGEAYT